MAEVVRKDDLCSGHSTFPPRIPTSYSPDVFANTLNVVRETDSWAVHCCSSVCHGGVSTGGGTVFVNGLVIQVVGDPIDCGSTHAQGSPDVFAKGA